MMCFSWRWTTQTSNSQSLWWRHTTHWNVEWPWLNGWWWWLRNDVGWRSHRLVSCLKLYTIRSLVLTKRTLWTVQSDVRWCSSSSTPHYTAPLGSILHVSFVLLLESWAGFQLTKLFYLAQKEARSSSLQLFIKWVFNFWKICVGFQC